MKDVLSFCFYGLFAAILLGVITPLAPNFKGPLLVGTGIVFLLFFLRNLTPILTTFAALSQKTEIPDLFNQVWKGLGISVLVSVCASFCRDLGEDGIAGKIELCGKTVILALSLPILDAVLSLLDEVL